MSFYATLSKDKETRLQALEDSLEIIKLKQSIAKIAPDENYFKICELSKDALTWLTLQGFTIFTESIRYRCECYRWQQSQACNCTRVEYTILW